MTKREMRRAARVAYVREAENMLGCSLMEWRRLLIELYLPPRAMGRGILTARGTTGWDATRVRRLMARIGKPATG
jgi:hypothetical protein